MIESDKVLDHEVRFLKSVKCKRNALCSEHDTVAYKQSQQDAALERINSVLWNDAAIKKHAFINLKRCLGKNVPIVLCLVLCEFKGALFLKSGLVSVDCSALL